MVDKEEELNNSNINLEKLNKCKDKYKREDSHRDIEYK